MEGRKKLLLGIVTTLLLIWVGIYFNFQKEEVIRGEKVTLTNPVTGMTIEEAVENFDEDYVLYLLASLGVQDLHNPPLSSDTPKIIIFFDDEVYSAEIRDGGIAIGEGVIADEDIIIRTSKFEGVKMLQDRGYVVKSFNEGISGVELVAGKTRLVAKGYLGLYDRLTG